MRACTVCTHPKKSEIDGALMEGVSGREVARQFGLSKSAVGRHRNGCLAPRLEAAARIVAPVKAGQAEVKRAKAIVAGEVDPTADDILSLSGLVNRIDRSLARLDGAAEDAFDTKSHAALAALSAQLHRGIEVVAKMQGLGDQEPERAPYSITINLGPKTPAVLAPKIDDIEL